MEKKKLIQTVLAAVLGVSLLAGGSAEALTPSKVKASGITQKIISPIKQVQTVTGILTVSYIEGKHYELKTDTGRLVLVGNTLKLKGLVGEEVTLKGILLKNRVTYYQRGTLFQVISVESPAVIIPYKPTPPIVKPPVKPLPIKPVPIKPVDPVYPIDPIEPIEQM